MEIIRSLGIENAVLSGSKIRIDEHLDQTAAINKALVTAGLAVDEIHTTNISLEDYYLSLTGGKHDD